MDKIQIANILLTRRCNLRCDYCSIVRDYEGMPTEYPSMKYHKDHELDVTVWIEIIERLRKNNPDVFLIFYGGEPFLYSGLTELINYCHEKDIYYTIISNNTEEIQPRILQLWRDVGTIRGFSASVDPSLYNALMDLHPSKDHAVWKTLVGYKNLRELKKNKIADDVVAEITITHDNCIHLYDTVKILSEADIYSSITTIDLKKSNYYDFSTITDKSLLVQPDSFIAKQFMDIMADESLKVHIPQMLIKLYNILPCEMKCKIYEDVNNVTIDSDGSFRLCLRIRGTISPAASLNNVINEDGNVTGFFKDTLKRDYDSYCKGCNHTCLLMSKYYSQGIVIH